MEINLIQIEWSTKEQGVDFTISASDEIQGIIQRNKSEVIEMLEKLTKRLKNNEYPFNI